MTLGAARARLVGTLALGVGIAVVLGAATFIARRTIEAPGTHSTPPVLRPAAVFAPTLLRDVTGPRDIDAITAPGMNPTAPPQQPAAALSHAPQPIPEELLLALGPPAPAPEVSAPAAPPQEKRAAPPASRPKPAPPAGPHLEMLDQNLWGPSDGEPK